MHWWHLCQHGEAGVFSWRGHAAISFFYHQNRETNIWTMKAFARRSHQPQNVRTTFLQRSFVPRSYHSRTMFGSISFYFRTTFVPLSYRSCTTLVPLSHHSRTTLVPLSHHSRTTLVQLSYHSRTTRLSASVRSASVRAVQFSSLLS